MQPQPPSQSQSHLQPEIQPQPSCIPLQYLNTSGEINPFSLSSLATPEIPDDILLKGYQVMMLTRLIDERMITLQRQGIISFAMSSLGEEACAVASAAALQLEDWMYPQYRESGIMFWRGCTPLQYIHHMFGDGEDWILGRQMPNHFGSKALNVVTVSSPIGTKIPHAAGCAYAMKVQKEPTIAICYFGEGAASEGDFHAGVNFAAVRKAPAIFFCRNNGYAISTPIQNQYAGEGIAVRGKAYGIPAYYIDGNDFFAVYDTVKKAKALCLEGKGPVLIEAVTFRSGAHSTSDDPSAYRQEILSDPWIERCPILRLRRYLEKKQLWDAKKEEVLIKEYNDQITTAINTAKETPRAPLSKMFEGVYFDLPQSLKEQYDEVFQNIKNVNDINDSKDIN